MHCTFTEPEFSDIHRIIGSTILAWNSLHVHLSRIDMEMSGENDEGKTLSKWHDPKRTDGQNRNELRDKLPNSAIFTAPEKADIEWLLDRVKCLSDHRNVIAHAPFTLIANGHKPIPDIFYGDRLAFSAWHRELEEYANWIRETALQLKQYADHILRYVSHPSLGPWPNKPPLLPESPVINPFAALVVSAGRKEP